MLFGLPFYFKDCGLFNVCVDFRLDWHDVLLACAVFHCLKRTFIRFEIFFENSLVAVVVGVAGGKVLQLETTIIERLHTAARSGTTI